jgi:hypothetical protein
VRSPTNKQRAALRKSREDNNASNALTNAQLYGRVDEWVPGATLSKERHGRASWDRLMRLDKHVWPPSS